MNFSELFRNENLLAIFLVFMVPITAIVVAGIVTIVKMLIRHRERMAMIEQGLDPDMPKEEVVVEDDPSSVLSRPVKRWVRQTAPRT